MKTPLLSVVVPTHNVLPWIDQTIDSLLDQDVDLEIIVVDDASTDGTPDYLRTRADADPRLVVLRAEVRGGANARNQGARAARGEYLAFADGDDLVPNDAYDAMLQSLLGSGSDMAVGDFLKFNASRTWRPTARWPDWQMPQQRARLSEVPSLIRGRACWNRVFRTSFWREVELRFPEVPRSNDIQPMTMALVSATSIDIVDACVYLYRDRPGQTSMSFSAGADASANSYFEQEAACAQMVSAYGSVDVSEVYSALVFDSDTWVHVSRYLQQLPTEESLPDNVSNAFDILMRAVPRNALNSAAANRRALFLLLEIGQFELARRFNFATGVDCEVGADTLAVWAEATTVLVESAPLDLDIAKFLQDGLLTQLVDHARQSSDDQLTGALQHLSERVNSAIADTREWIESSALRAMARAAALQDLASIRRVSVVQGAAPLVVGNIRAGWRELTLEGELPSAIAYEELEFVALAQTTGQAVQLDLRAIDPGRFAVAVRSDRLSRGRFEVRANVAVAEDLVVEVAVVTARMPIPTSNSLFSLQALSDRRRSWRLIVDRRPLLLARLAATGFNRLRSMARR